MERKILNRWTDAVLWAGEAETVKDAIHAALAAGADLRRAVLTGADLRRAVLTGAVLTPIRDDLWAVLSSARREVPGLLAALTEGRVNGSTYSGECACLVGTLANVRGCDYSGIPGLTPNSARPAERFFLAISPGQTPANHEPARIAADWITEWLANVRTLVAPTPESL
jgi:hypothetical protein